MVFKRAALIAVAAATAALLFLAVPGLGRPTGGDARSKAKVPHATVRVMDNFFDPRSTGVGEGGKVTFVWKGTNRHNVRFTQVPPGASKKSSRKKREGHWTRKFAKPGLYRYICTLYAGMRGTITVKPPTSGEG
jgi:plastocyanin